MDERLFNIIIPGIIGLSIGTVYVYAEVEHFRYRDEKYQPLIWQGINFLFREASSELRYKKFQSKRMIHKIRYPIKTDCQGYIIQDDVPLIKENDHTRKIMDNVFLVAQRNETTVIENLESLVGFPIRALEHRMYPDNQTFDDISLSGYLGSNPSFGGFLKYGERLITRLATDNDYVLSRDLTHQEIAKPLLYVYQLFERTQANELKLEYNNTRYHASVSRWPMGQMSPFSNKFVVGADDITVTRVEDGTTFKFTSVHPFMVHGFGFYEGDVKFRIEPPKIIEFFKITSTHETSSS